MRTSTAIQVDVRFEMKSNSFATSSEKFNVPELQRIAASCVGARMCISMTKLAEGSSNKVFQLVMDNGKIVIDRIPNPNAGPECYYCFGSRDNGFCANARMLEC
jgi:hypothetical protein